MGAKLLGLMRFHPELWPKKVILGHRSIEKGTNGALRWSVVRQMSQPRQTKPAAWLRRSRAYSVSSRRRLRSRRATARSKAHKPHSPSELQPAAFSATVVFDRSFGTARCRVWHAETVSRHAPWWLRAAAALKDRQHKANRQATGPRVSATAPAAMTQTRHDLRHPCGCLRPGAEG